MLYRNGHSNNTAVPGSVRNDVITVKNGATHLGTLRLIKKVSQKNMMHAYSAISLSKQLGFETNQTRLERDIRFLHIHRRATGCCH
jgi:hypothetical protein